MSAINPQLELSYGITNSVEFEMYLSEVSWWQSSGNGQSAQSGSELGDTTAFLKYQFNVQQDETWWPSLTNAFYVSLPSSEWAGTPPIPCGFAPLGRLPSTHFGSPEFEARPAGVEPATCGFEWKQDGFNKARCFEGFPRFSWGCAALGRF